MDISVVNINELNNWQYILIYIEKLYKKLIESEKNHDECSIKYYSNEIIKNKEKEKALIDSLNISKNNCEQIFSYISKITDKHISLRMYALYEPILLEIEKYKGELNLLKFIDFQKKKIDHTKRLEINSYLMLNKIYVLKKAFDSFDDDLIIEQIYEIAYTNPNIEQQILNDEISLIFMDKSDVYYPEIKKHLRNNIISIMLEMKINPNVSELENMINYIEIVNYLTFLNDDDLILEITRKVDNDYSSNILKKALGKTRELLNYKDKIKKAN